MEYKIKSRIWIETGDRVLIGEGRVSLLKAIDETGSLSKAAKLLNMSYNKAWNLIDSVNKTSDKKVTINSVGGKGGGGAKLTPYGKSLVTAFDSINKKCWKYLREQEKIINSL